MRTHNMPPDFMFCTNCGSENLIWQNLEYDGVTPITVQCGSCQTVIWVEPEPAPDDGGNI